MTENLIVDAAEAAIPGVAEVKAGMATAQVVGRVLLIGLAVLVILLGLNTVFGWLSDPFGLKRHQLAAAQTQAATATGTAAVATGQAAAAGDAAKIIDAGRAKADVTVHIQQENARALAAAPGSGQAVDPGLAAALARGLCLYAAYAADPGCAALRAPDPGQLPPADPGNPAAGADGR